MKKSLPFVFATLILHSCHEDTTPSWLHIDSIGLTTNATSEGVNSHKIVDAWVYMDNKPLGVFELPCKIPVLAEGQHEFIIYAGVQINGKSGTRLPYPFYERIDTTLTLVKNGSVTINPIVTYKKNLLFPLKEEFESTGIQFTQDIISDTPLVFINKINNPDIVKYGNRCGGIFLTQTDSVFKAATHAFFDLPRGEDVFLELDYRSDNSAVMGVISQNSADLIEHTPYVGFNTNQDWTKMYIALEEDVSFHTNATSHEIYLLSILDPENTNAVIYLDNIKIVCYE